MAQAAIFATTPTFNFKVGHPIRRVDPGCFFVGMLLNVLC